MHVRIDSASIKGMIYDARLEEYFVNNSRHTSETPPPVVHLLREDIKDECNDMECMPLQLTVYGG